MGKEDPGLQVLESLWLELDPKSVSSDKLTRPRSPGLVRSHPRFSADSVVMAGRVEVSGGRGKRSFSMLIGGGGKRVRSSVSARDEKHRSGGDKTSREPKGYGDEHKFYSCSFLDSPASKKEECRKLPLMR
ncbi:hypothetical protein E2C01_045199 [Portunus trituberculatus]|uniref:Uncharacterized protein n=1 Tax=Portunus trituberculatus TaxID=210409 RepID=A0A5B7G4D8_PORTR|nr:hypothetical protein [Portunus trituberculatus]